MGHVSCDLNLFHFRASKFISILVCFEDDLTLEIMIFFIHFLEGGGGSISKVILSSNFSLDFEMVKCKLKELKNAPFVFPFQTFLHSSKIFQKL